MHGNGFTDLEGVQGTINPSDFEPGCETRRTSSTLSSMSNLQEMADALECALGKGYRVLRESGHARPCSE